MAGIKCFSHCIGLPAETVCWCNLKFIHMFSKNNNNNEKY